MGDLDIRGRGADRKIQSFFCETSDLSVKQQDLSLQLCIFSSVPDPLSPPKPTGLCFFFFFKAKFTTRLASFPIF